MATGKPVEGASVKFEIDNYQSIEPFGDQTTALKTDANGLVALPGTAQIDPKLTHINQVSI